MLLRHAERDAVHYHLNHLDEFVHAGKNPETRTYLHLARWLEPLEAFDVEVRIDFRLSSARETNYGARPSPV